MRKLISIIVPTYKKNSVINEVLDSLINSTQDLESEIIVINDNDVVILERCLVNNKVKLVTISDGFPSVAKARNIGLKIAQGEYVAFIDADILCNKDNLKAHLWNLERGYDISLGLIHNYLPNNTLNKNKQDNRHTLDFSKTIHPWCYFWCGNIMVRRSLLEPFDENFAGWGLEDIELGLRLYKKGAKFCLTKEAVGKHIPHLRSPAKQLCQYFYNWRYFYNKFPYPIVELLSIHDCAQVNAFIGEYRKLPSDFLIILKFRGELCSATLEKIEDWYGIFSSTHGRIMNSLCLKAFMPSRSVKSIHVIEPGIFTLSRAYCIALDNEIKRLCPTFRASKYSDYQLSEDPFWDC